MPQSAVISIPSPCTEPWEQMTTVSGGRHCASCQKTVQDFSTFSDRELANWLSTYNGEAVCGRLRTNQLERSIRQGQVRSEQGKNGGWVRWAMALVLGWQTAKGQTVPDRPTSSPTSLSPVIARNAFILTEPILFYVTGQVVNEDNVPYKSTIVRNERNGTFILTDDGGNFRLPIHKSDQVQDSLQLGIIGDGSRRCVTVSTKQENAPLLLTMYATEPSRSIVGGGLVIVQQKQAKRRSFWQFLVGKR